MSITEPATTKTTPHTADEPPVIDPDDLTKIAEQEAAAAKSEEAPASGEAGPATGEDDSPAAASHLPAVPDAAPTPVVIESKALQAFVDDEWAGFDDADGGLMNWQHVGFAIPRIVSDMRPGGGLTDEVTGDKTSPGANGAPGVPLEVIVVAAMPNRALFAKKFGTGDGVPDCRSNDMVHADASAPAMQADWAPPSRDDDDAVWFTKPTGVCATCPASFWRGDQPPACGERINMLVYLPESGEVRRMAVGGTSTKHFRKYASSLRARAAGKPIYAQTTVITLKDEDDGRMRWIEAHFTEGEPVSPREAAATIKPLKDKLVEQWTSLLAETLASGEAETPGAAAEDVIDVESRYADEEPF